LLPTILFILGAYGLYALAVVWCQWQRSRFLGRRGKGRPRWLTLAGGAVFLGVFLTLLFWLAPANTDQKVSLAGILGVSEAEVGLAKQADLRAASLHIDQTPANGQPAYALLHPESPPSLQPPAKPPVGKNLHKLKGKQASELQRTKMEARLNKKDKAAGKIRAKKKKASQPTTMNSTQSGNSNG
jgi:apolipoprotein N-acyltransferase